MPEPEPALPNPMNPSTADDSPSPGIESTLPDPMNTETRGESVSDILLKRDSGDE